MSTTIEPLPCPFCGVRPIIDRENPERTILKHSHCSVIQLMVIANTGNLASDIERWNTRLRGKKVVKEQLAVLPLELNTTEFKIAWDGWLKHLREKKKFPTRSAQERQLKKCAAWGIQFSIEIIDHCIERNWQSLFEPNGAGAVKKADPLARF